MKWKRMAFLIWLVFLALLPLASLAEEGAYRALLIGVDEFVSRPSAYPSSSNNVTAMQEMFQQSLTPLDALIVPAEPVTDEIQLRDLIQSTFGAAAEEDVSCLYLSTHGIYEEGGEAALLMSNGVIENRLTAAQLEAAFEGIAGTKLIILDACSSGAFIGKGMASSPDTVHFTGEDFKVLTSSGALEESWYWSAGELGGQGAFYFTQALAEGLSARSGYPADQNRDGAVTLTEAYDYLLLSHAASTPQVYPQEDDFVLLRYDADAPPPQGLMRSPVVDVTFSGSVLDRETRQIGIEFIATRPVRVAYQIVYQRDGRWEFDKAERFTAFGDEPGAISAGRKLRSVHLGKLDEDDYGYVLVQLVSIDQGKLTVHAGRVICVPPESGEMTLTASVDERLDLSSGRELSIFIGHDFPCTLSVAVVDENDKVVRRLCHRQSTRPIQITPAGSVLYWDGTDRDGVPVEPGTYRVRAQAHMNDTSMTVWSSVFMIE